MLDSMTEKMRRINLDIVELILNELQKCGKSKRTNLALNCKIPYHRFMKYLCVMILLHLLEVTETIKGKYVCITDAGTEFLKSYFSE